MSTQKAEGPRGGGGGGGRDKTQPTPTELLALAERWESQAASSEADADRLGNKHSAHNELLRDSAQYRQSAYQLRTVLTTLSAREDGWLPIETAPRDSTVIVVTEATAKNDLYGDGGHRQSLPAYIDSDGVVCDSGTWKPDTGIVHGVWRAILWQPLPSPPKAPTAGEGKK